MPLASQVGGDENIAAATTVFVESSFRIGHIGASAIIVHSEQEREGKSTFDFTLFLSLFLLSCHSPREHRLPGFSSTFEAHDLGASTSRRDPADDPEDDIRGSIKCYRMYYIAIISKIKEIVIVLGFNIHTGTKRNINNIHILVPTANIA